MNYLKPLVPLGFLGLAGAILNAVGNMAQRGYAGILWTLGAFLCVSFVALALYSIKVLYGKKDEDDKDDDEGE